MSTAKLARLQTRLAAIDSRIAEVVAAYPTLAKVKSYSQGFGAVSTTYQVFSGVADEYHRLLSEKERLEAEIEALQTAEDSGSYAVQFYGAEA